MRPDEPWLRDDTTPGYQVDDVNSWLDRLFTGAPGWVSVGYTDGNGAFRTAGHAYRDWSFAAEAMDDFAADGATGIFVRCTTLRTEPAAGRRGSALDSMALPMLWSDIDFGTVGHCEPRNGRLPLPPDEDAAGRVVTDSGLPEPTVWVHSGGGYYACWMLDEPLLLEGRLDEAAAASSALQKILSASAHRLGFSYDDGVGDLSRMLRVPGTVNAKADIRRQCRVEQDGGPVYSFAHLQDAVLRPRIAVPTTLPVTSALSLQVQEETTAVSATHEMESMSADQDDDKHLQRDVGVLADSSTRGNGSPALLLPQHANMLAAAGITHDHIARRGYASITDKEQLPTQPHRFAAAGTSVPGLLIPLRRSDGSTWGYHYRPDHPRKRQGKSCKYEVPVDQRNGLDVPPGVGPQLGDPKVPLFVTEGVKKADSAAVRRLCCIALAGVWSWIGTNSHGGKTAVADWHDVALNGRRVILAFDSDVVRKKSVRAALESLAGYLRGKGANIEYLHLPDGADGKTGLDDYLSEGNTFTDLMTLVKPNPPATTEVSATTSTDATQEAALTSDVADVALVALRQKGQQIDGAALLDTVRNLLARHVAFPSPDACVAVALWIAHTYALTAWASSPRLALISPEPQSGKTRTLELLDLLAYLPMFTSNTSVAVLAHSIEVFLS